MSKEVTRVRLSELLDCAKNGNSKVICAFEIVQLITELTDLRKENKRLEKIQKKIKIMLGDKTARHGHSTFTDKIDAIISDQERKPER